METEKIQFEKILICLCKHGKNPTFRVELSDSFQNASHWTILCERQSLDTIHLEYYTLTVSFTCNTISGKRCSRQMETIVCFQLLEVRL